MSSKTGTRQSRRTHWWLPAAVFLALFITAFTFVIIGVSTDPAPLGVTGFLLTYGTDVALVVVSASWARQEFGNPETVRFRMIHTTRMGHTPHLPHVAFG